MRVCDDECYAPAFERCFVPFCLLLEATLLNILEFMNLNEMSTCNTKDSYDRICKQTSFS
jgi:hypothetical protein